MFTMNAVALRKRKISMEITQQHWRERERENGKCIMSYFPHHGCAATTFDEGTALYKNNAHQKIEIFSFFPK